MSRLLTYAAWEALKPHLLGIKIVLDDEVKVHGRKNRAGQPIKNCISKGKALLLSTKRGSLGLLIKKRIDNNGYRFLEYTGATLGAGEFAIETMVILDIFSTLLYLNDTPKNSLIVFLFDADNIIIELSGDDCRDDDSGGDGVKVRLPS